MPRDTITLVVINEHEETGYLYVVEHDLARGYGNTLPDAMRDLADQMEDDCSL